MYLATLAEMWGFGERAVSNRVGTVQILMIGSSLTRYGMPDPEGGPAAIASGPLQLLNYSGASGGTSAQAAQHGVQRLYIEIKPIFSRFAYATSRCGLTARAKLRLSDMRQTFRALVMGQGTNAHRRATAR
jgi:hypothetical protein